MTQPERVPRLRRLRAQPARRRGDGRHAGAVRPARGGWLCDVLWEHLRLVRVRDCVRVPGRRDERGPQPRSRCSSSRRCCTTSPSRSTRTVDAGRPRALLRPRRRGRGDGARDHAPAALLGAARRAFVSTLVAEHLRPVQLAQAGEAPTRRALYRFYRDLGEACPAVLLLALADAAAARGPSMTPEGWSRQVAYMNSLLVRSREEEGIVHPPRLLSGHDIMADTRDARRASRRAGCSKR